MYLGEREREVVRSRWKTSFGKGAIGEEGVFLENDTVHASRIYTLFEALFVRR